MDKDTIIENILILLKVQNITVSEPVLNLYVDKVIQYILNYCNLKELPDELCYTVIDIVVNECSKAQSSSNSDGLASLSEDGRSVSFVTEVSKLPMYIEFDNKQKSILNKFKRFYKYDWFWSYRKKST